MIGGAGEAAYRRLTVVQRRSEFGSGQQGTGEGRAGGQQGTGERRADGGKQLSKKGGRGS